MRKDKGLNGELDRLPQLTWMMFLKFLDDMEIQGEAEAVLTEKPFAPLIPAPYRWRDWASYETGLTGQELVSFINNDRIKFPDDSEGPGLLAKLRTLQGEGGPDRRDVVAKVFAGITNRMTNGYLLRDVAEKLKQLDFNASDDVHTLSALYEVMLREMRDAAGDSGEFYTPRPVVELLVKMLDPKLGESVLDPACGTGGFLVAAFDHLRAQTEKVDDLEALLSIKGQEAKSLPYLLAQMNMLLHGATVPDIELGNSLAVRLGEIGDNQRVDVILTNPPFGGEEETAIKAGFPADGQTAETVLLFLQLIMRRIARPGHATNGKSGRAGVVVPNGLLFGDGVAARIKGKLLKEFNLRCVVRLPKGVFSPYTDIASNLLIFDHDGPTTDIWYYEHPLPVGRKQYVKTRPLKKDELEPLLTWWSDPRPTDQAWMVPVSDLLVYDAEGSLMSCNLDVRNPSRPLSDADVPIPDVMTALAQRHEEIAATLRDITKLVRVDEA